MKATLRVFSLFLVIAVLLAACGGWDPFGLGNIRVRVEPELGPETLERVDKINETLASGIEIGPETRAVIEELNQTLAEGVKVGLDEDTLARVDALLAQIEQGIGIKVGLDQGTLDSVNRLLDDVDEAPDKWESVAEQIIQTLEGSATNVGKEMANQIKSVLADARINLQQIMAAAGTELRCNVDFMGSRAGSTISEFMGRSIIGILHDIVEGKTRPKTTPIPWVCQMIPDQVELSQEGEKLVVDRAVVILTGYNFTEENNPEAYLVNEANQRIEAIKLYPYRQSGYQLQLNLQSIDFSTVPPRSRVVFKWPNVSDTSALAVLMPPPGVTPEPQPELTISAVRTDVTIGPGTKYNVVGVAEKGAKYLVTGRNGDSSWFQIDYDGKTGWVPATACQRNEIPVEVVSIPLPPPTANFKPDVASGPAPLTVEFTDLSTDAPTRWKWEFGDGTTSSEQNPAHKYATQGHYSVKLTVTNSQGSDSKSFSNLINVTAPPPGPVAGFSGTPRSGYAPLTVRFTDSSSGAPTSWKWNFGDGKSATDRSPTHTYNDPGRYTVSLTVKNTRGENTRTISEYIVVNRQPTLPACYTVQTSDEYGAVSCQSGFAVNSVKCTGDYCDNMYLTCCPYMSGTDPAANYTWSPWFSEESPGKYISPNGFVTGLQCRHDHCDSLHLRILVSTNLKHVGACQTLNIFSEEQSDGSTCSAGYFVSGMECWGKYCDNMRLTCCQAGK